MSKINNLHIDIPVPDKSSSKSPVKIHINNIQFNITADQIVGDIICKALLHDKIQLGTSGSYSITLTLKDNVYIMYAQDLARIWNEPIETCGVIGYMHVLDPTYDLDSRESIWQHLDGAVISIIPSTMRTMSKLKHSIVRLLNGNCISSQLIKTNLKVSV